MRALSAIATILGLVIASALLSPGSDAQEYSAGYNIGNPTVIDLYINPDSGLDTNDGLSPSRPLKQIKTAWTMIPSNRNLDIGYRINLMRGTYTASNAPSWWADRFGTFQNPIIIQPYPATEIRDLPFGMNIFNVRHFYLYRLSLTQAGGDVVQCASCRNFLIRQCSLNGGSQQAQEVIKVNQSQYVYVEDSNLSGAWDNAFDSMASQYGHLLRNKIHNSGSWCGYVKGGSAYWLIEGNEFYNCGEGGFTAGQGSGIEFSVLPWAQYQASNVKVINNVVHDIVGGGLGVSGGYNVLVAHNTVYRVGTRSHLFGATTGAAGCDGTTAVCQQILNAGGWGTLSRAQIAIPSKNVFVYNNIFFNPPGFETQWQHFFLGPSSTNPAGSQPATASADENLRIVGNVVYNGSVNKPLGTDNGGCHPSNPTCNATQLVRDNAVNTILPQLVNPAGGDFRPVQGGNLFSYSGAAIPHFAGGDLPSLRPPEGNLQNLVSFDFNRSPRSTRIVGAFGASTASTPAPTATATSIPTVTPTRAATPTTAATSIPTTAPTIAISPPSSPTPGPIKTQIPVATAAPIASPMPVPPVVVKPNSVQIFTAIQEVSDTSTFSAIEVKSLLFEKIANTRRKKAISSLKEFTAKLVQISGPESLSIPEKSTRKLDSSGARSFMWNVMLPQNLKGKYVFEVTIFRRATLQVVGRKRVRWSQAPR